MIRSGSNLTWVNQTSTTRSLGSKYLFFGQLEPDDSIGLESFLSQSEPDILISELQTWFFSQSEAIHSVGLKSDWSQSEPDNQIIGLQKKASQSEPVNFVTGSV